MLQARYMLRKPSFAVIIASLYLLTYYVIFHFGQNFRTLLWMFMGAPFILGWLAYVIIRFGKYEGRLLCDLPVSYLEWFQRKGFPPGKLGMLLSTMHEIKSNGLEYLLDPLKKGAAKS